MHPKLDPDTSDLIASNRLLIEAAREMIAQADRERERLRVAIKESQKLRDRWGYGFRERIERPGARA